MKLSTCIDGGVTTLQFNFQNITMRRTERTKCPMTLNGPRNREMNMGDALAARKDNQFRLCQVFRKLPVPHSNEKARQGFRVLWNDHRGSWKVFSCRQQTFRKSIPTHPVWQQFSCRILFIMQEGHVPGFMEDILPCNTNLKQLCDVDVACHSDFEVGKHIKGVAAIGRWYTR